MRPPQVRIFPPRITDFMEISPPSGDDDAAWKTKSLLWHWTGAFLKRSNHESASFSEENLKTLFMVISCATWKIALMFPLRQTHKSCSIFINTLTAADDTEAYSRESWHVLLMPTTEWNEKLQLFSSISSFHVSGARLGTKKKTSW